MADIQVRIKLNAGVDGDQINSVAFNQETNNVSKAVGSKTTKNDGQNLISWGEDGLISLADGYVGGANSTLSSQGGYNGFVFGVVPDNKMYSVEITLEGSNIDSVTFYGDKNASQFPTRAIVNGEYIYSDDAEWTIIFPTSANSQTITFDMWNRANYNACFTHIGAFTNELVLNKRSIKSVESLSQSTGQPKEIYYGFTPTSGKVEIIDVDGEIYDYVSDEILDIENLNLEIDVNGNVLASHLSNDSNYEPQSKTFSINLSSDKDSKLKNVGFNETIVNENITDYSANNGISLKEILKKYVFNNTNIDEMLKEKTFVYPMNEEITIDQYLQIIKTNYFYCFNKTKKDILDEICMIAQIAFVYAQATGYKFISTRKIVQSNISCITIPKKNMFSSFSEDFIIKNKYNRVKINQPEVVHKVDSVYSKEFTIREEGQYPYDVSLMGLDAQYIHFVDTNTHFIVFSDSVKYSEDLMFVFNNQNSKWSIELKAPTLIASNNTSTTVQRTGKIDLNNPSKDEFVMLSNPNISHNNNIPYDFYFRVNVKPYTPNPSEAGVNYWYYSMLVNLLTDTYRINSQEFVYGDGDKEISFNGNILMSNSTFLDYLGEKTPMPKVFSENILNDYKKGVRTASVTISCNDYYDENGNKVKNWENGEIVDVGDFVKVEGSNKIWRVSSRNFRKVGVPMIDLELQELII